MKWFKRMVLRFWIVWFHTHKWIVVSNGPGIYDREEHCECGADRINDQFETVIYFPKDGA